MFFILVKNYFRSLWDNIHNIDLTKKKIKRIKRRFLISEYIVDIDFLSSYEKSELKNLDEVNTHYDQLMIEGDKNWKLDGYLYAYLRSLEENDSEGAKTIVGFIEYVVLTDRAVLKGWSFRCMGVRTYINRFNILTRSDIRNETLNKLLEIK